MQKVRRHRTSLLRPLVSTRFQVLFHFPHGTSSLSVTREYLALRGGPRGFRPGFSCPAVLRNNYRECTYFRVRGLYPLWREFPPTSANACICNSPTALRRNHESSYNPRPATSADYRSCLLYT